MNSINALHLRVGAALCLLALSIADVHAGDQDPAARPRVGVAFGGGSARGLAHVGILRWFEEHHIPIDRIAGTSMGGLIGGAYRVRACQPPEIAHLLGDDRLGRRCSAARSFRYKNIRRKQDARAYPSRIEFGLKQGLTPPVALNNGQQVDFLLTRIGGAYQQLQRSTICRRRFAASPSISSPRNRSCSITDRSPDAMRATMSLPGIFPPMEIDGHVLVDGGAMNNVPADVVRAMGADVVIAINVGFMGDKRTVNYSLMGLMGQTVDVMMQANTRRAMQGADIVINPALEEFAQPRLAPQRGARRRRIQGSGGDEGQAAAAGARRRRLARLPGDAAGAEEVGSWGTPQFLSIVGAVDADQRRMEEVLKAARRTAARRRTRSSSTSETFVGPRSLRNRRLAVGHRERAVRAADPRAAEDLCAAVSDAGRQPPEHDDRRFRISARRPLPRLRRRGIRSELRVDAAVGVQPNIGVELVSADRRDSPLFVSGTALAIQAAR